MPKLVVLLIVWFLWAAGKDLDALIRFSTTTDYYIFSSAGVPWLFFAVALSVFTLNTSGVYYLFRPSPIGLKIILSAFIAGAIQNILTISLALPNLPLVREAYATGREIRGLPVREEALNLMFTESALAISCAIMLLVYSLAAFIAYRHKQYFHVITQPEV